MSAPALLTVVAKPGSRRPGISLVGGVVEVRVNEPARDGRANEAVRAMLAAALGRPRTAVVLVRGATVRRKTFEVSGLALPAALERLSRAGDGA